MNLRGFNNLLKKMDIKAELVHGEGYFYFVGDDIITSGSSSVIVYSFSDLSLDEWLTELSEFKIVKEN